MNKREDKAHAVWSNSAS